MTSQLDRIEVLLLELRNELRERFESNSDGVDSLSVAAAAKRLNVHEDTVYRLVKRGRLRATRVGRAWRIRATVVDAFLERGGRR